MEQDLTVLPSYGRVPRRPGKSSEMKVGKPSIIRAKISESWRIKVCHKRVLKVRNLPSHLPSIMTTTNGCIPTVPEDNPRCSYDGFALHPDIPVKSTSILYTMEDNEFEWNQHWINLYWAKADKTLRIREEESQSQKVREKRKRTGGKAEGPERKKLKVSNNSFIP